MSHRSPSMCRCRNLAAGLVAATGGVASVGQTQQLSASIGVSLTILQPIVGQPMRVTGFSVDRTDLARLETTIPTAARVSQVVMVRVSSSTWDVAPDARASVLVPPSDSSTRMHLFMHVGRASRNATPRRLGLRIEYLTVAGT